MPFKSEKQRRWMHVNNPKMAAKWEKEEKKVKREMKIRELIKKLVREIMSEEKLTEAKETPIDVAKRVVKNHQYEKYKGVMLDGFTASAIVQVYDKVNDATKKKLEKLPLPKLVNVVWKVMK